MSFTVVCPTCQKSLRATDQHIGKKAKCPQCGTRVTIQRPEREFGDEDPYEEAPIPRVEPKRKIDPSPVHSEKKRLSVPMIAGIAVVSAILGYFAGREHLKYEFRSAVSQNFANAFGPGPALKKEIEEKKAEEAAFQQQPPLSVGQVHAAPGFKLALVDVRISPAKMKSTFGDEPIDTDEKYLICTFQVTNTDDRKILHFRDSDSFGPHNFVLVDDVDNRIRGVSFGFSGDLVGALSITDDIQPGQQCSHIEVFTIPPPKTQSLELKVNLKAFDGEGLVKFQIPADKIQGFRQP